MFCYHVVHRLTTGKTKPRRYRTVQAAALPKSAASFDIVNHACSKNENGMCIEAHHAILKVPYACQTLHLQVFDSPRHISVESICLLVALSRHYVLKAAYVSEDGMIAVSHGASQQCGRYLAYSGSYHSTPEA
jgi:hypothetical protein